MSAYSELIKNFEKVRDYMREFYVYGFKSRNEYTGKSARTYDDERRRMESWLGEHMSFVKTPEGKNVFISIDSRVIAHNPLYKAWKAKSFTDGDITLHFILFDILSDSTKSFTLAEIMDKTDCEYLSCFENPKTFDESTVCKKLKEYVELGVVECMKCGKSSVYRRAEDTVKLPDAHMLHFFSEVAPCVAVGSFLLDRSDETERVFGFKHHYITGALDNNVTALLFEAMRRRCEITAVNCSRRSNEPKNLELVPLRIFISVQNGRQHLLAFIRKTGQIKSYRIDYLSDIRFGEVCENFEDYRGRLDFLQKNMWGVGCGNRRLEHIEFTVLVDKNEGYIVQRLEREKRCGTVCRIDDTHYRFSADVYDANELVPWIRSYICRITELDISNKEIEQRFKNDILDMYKMYGIEGGGIGDIQ